MAMWAPAPAAHAVLGDFDVPRRPVVPDLPVAAPGGLPPTVVLAFYGSLRHSVATFVISSTFSRSTTYYCYGPETEVEHTVAFGFGPHGDPQVAGDLRHAPPSVPARLLF
jgi:hypothetical protein